MSKNNLSQDAIVVMLGFNFEKFEVVYSYDFTVSELSPASGGTHEISVRYRIPINSSKRTRKKEKFIHAHPSCISFKRAPFLGRNGHRCLCLFPYLWGNFFALSMNFSKELAKNEVFNVVSRASKDLGLQSWVVGGYVRDLILDRRSNDIDFVCLGSGINLAKKVAVELGNLQVSVFKISDSDDP